MKAPPVGSSPRRVRHVVTEIDRVRGQLAEVAATAAPAVPAGPSAFERRRILRDKRHGLVADLGRRDRRIHKDINAWLNTETGIARVQDATLDQLERSVELLLDALTGSRRSLNFRCFLS